MKKTGILLLFFIAAVLLPSCAPRYTHGAPPPPRHRRGPAVRHHRSSPGFLPGGNPAGRRPAKGCDCPSFGGRQTYDCLADGFHLD